MTIKQLQAQYKAGKLTKEAYLAALKELLDGKEISQEDHDGAKDFDPTKDGVAIYTQEDVDGMVTRKALGLVRKALKDAGVTVDVDNKGLLPKVAELAKAGTDQKPPTATEQEITELRKKADKYDAVAGDTKRLTLENAVLRVAGKFNPHNPAQVVRALKEDYGAQVEYDDLTGELIPGSVEKAIGRLVKAEPNLFQDPAGAGAGAAGGGFGGKPPGGGTPPAGGTTDLEKKKAEALKLMGFEPKK